MSVCLAYGVYISESKMHAGRRIFWMLHGNGGSAAAAATARHPTIESTHCPHATCAGIQQVADSIKRYNALNAIEYINTSCMYKIVRI